MKRNTINKIRNVLRSLKFRVFVLIAVAVIVPTLVSSIFIYNVALDNYKEKRIETFDTANTVIKNTVEMDIILMKWRRIQNPQTMLYF